MAITYRVFSSEYKDRDIEVAQKLIAKDLSEPYSIYVYRYFIYQWSELCLLAYDGETPVGVIICDLRSHKDVRVRGYIAMVVVTESYRGQGIAKELIRLVVDALKTKNCDEIALETEVTNAAAMHLYENMGFIRCKRLHRYYLNSNDAFRLILPLTSTSTVMSQFLRDGEDIL